MDKVKEYDPQEVISAALTREQWGTVLHWLTYGADCHKATAYWWANGSSDKKVGAETAAGYERSAAKAESVRKIIEEALGEAL